jgi:hypothetical protein
MLYVGAAEAYPASPLVAGHALVDALLNPALGESENLGQLRLRQPWLGGDRTQRYDAHPATEGVSDFGPTVGVI